MARQESLSVEQWQRKFDAEYPQGVIASWADQDRQDGRTIYVIPRIEVTALAGLDPMVRLPVQASQVVLGPSRVMSYHQVTPEMARLEFGDRKMSWTSRMTEQLAQGLAADRAESVRRAPGGGSRVLTGMSQGT